MIKTDTDLRSRSHSPKAYLGCDTCKLKNNDLKKVKSISKLSDNGIIQEKNRNKKGFPEREKHDKKSKIKLMDLCDEDKKRIVELIEELSKFAEKNQQLKESLDRMQKTNQDQQDYIMKQASLHLEEKNFYVNEINGYKNKVENLENELMTKMSQWENHEKYLNAEMDCLAKALQKSLKEKKDINEQMNHLKICLKQSLESFQRLRAEVGELQREERLTRKFKATSCQTDTKTVILKDRTKVSDEDTEEDEFLSTCNQDSINAKSSLDIINDKLEHVYQLLKRKSESLEKQGAKRFDIDLSILLKRDKSKEELKEKDDCESTLDNHPKEESEEEVADNSYKFLKPFDQCSKTSIQAERILKKIGKPFNLDVNDFVQNLNQPITSFKLKDSAGDFETLSGKILHNKMIQKNNLFKSCDDHQYDEDRLLEELFYSEQNFDIETSLNLENKQPKKTSYNFPFS